MKQLTRNFIIFIIMGCIYMGIEMIWRGHTSLSMGIVGGLAGVIIGLLNEHFPWSLSVWAQCAIGAIVITILEGLSGLVLNVWLGLGIWDYSKMPGQFFYGQCCIPFTVAWFFLAGAAIFLDDILRYWLFDEEMPHYNWKL